MIELHHVYIFLMAASAVVALVLGSLAFTYRRATSSAEPFAAMMLGEVVWSGSMAFAWWLPTQSHGQVRRDLVGSGAVLGELADRPQRMHAVALHRAVLGAGADERPVQAAEIGS